ncbi:MAG: S9 family peptidase [Ignavibacteriales bacterium]|nr:S9 family peptidase [Ignavibacteriales bacterium]
MKKVFFLSVIFLTISNFLLPQKKAMTIDDLWAMKRVGDISLSPDGNTIAFALTAYDMEKNKGNTDIRLIGSDGKNLRTLKNSEKNEAQPKFSPDGKRIVYTLEDQIWYCNIDGSDDKQLTDLYTGASGLVWLKDGSKFLFVSSVYPECEDQNCNKTKDKAKEDSKVKASIFTELMFRHWDNWRGEKRSHLFLMELNKKNYVDLMLNSKSDCPPLALGSSNDYNFSPDGNEVVFTMNEADTLAASTNNDIFIIDLKDVKAGSKTPYKKISVSKGNDFQPIYSPDGKYIAFCSMERAGFEADRKRLMLFERGTGKTNELTNGFDFNVEEFIWSPDSKSIYFTSQKETNNPILKVDVSTGKIEVVLKEHCNANILISPDGKKLFFRQQRSNLPDEIFSMDNSGSNLQQISFLNKDILEKIEMNPMETFWCEGAGKTKVQSVLIKPPFFDANKKYPMIFLIHGGPQGKWEDEFHYRWNYQLFASRGYIVVAPNPRGSTGYGQKFTDEISRDWGGKVYTDLMNCYDYAIKNFNFIDKKNTFAAGASYGGYMTNWIEGHTNKFNALVSHDGTFNLESMYGTTEELWFPEWELGGKPWTNRNLYHKWSPHSYVQNFKTPMLVIHGAKDFRLSEEQAFQLFTSLQRMGVPSKLLYFPDETHFVTKPQNSNLWWNTIFDWFEKYRK